MPISFQHLKDNLLDSSLDLLWRQWSSLGVAGQRDDIDDRLIDPEALLLVTTRYGRYDPRLLDEVIDWLSSNGKSINLLRLRRIHETWPLSDERVLGVIGGMLAKQSAMRKWSAFSAKSDTLSNDPQSLFLRRDGTPLPVFENPDPDFLRGGLLRDMMELRGMSRSPIPSKAGNLLFYLRALFGVNARAEIIAWLLTHESGHPAAIARDTGYFSKSVQHTLNEMEGSGHVRSRRQGREKIFWMNPKDWDFLISWSQPAGFPRWVDWMPLFLAVHTFIDVLSQPNFHDSDEQVQSILLRQALDIAMPALSQAGLAESISASREQTGAQLIQAVQQDLDGLVKLLRH